MSTTATHTYSFHVPEVKNSTIEFYAETFGFEPDDEANLLSETMYQHILSDHILFPNEVFVQVATHRKYTGNESNLYMNGTIKLDLNRSYEFISKDEGIAHYDEVTEVFFKRLTHYLQTEFHPESTLKIITES